MTTLPPTRHSAPSSDETRCSAPSLAAMLATVDLSADIDLATWDPRGDLDVPGAKDIDLSGFTVTETPTRHYERPLWLELDGVLVEIRALTWADYPVTPEHAAKLDAAAVLPMRGVKSVATVEDLPEGSPEWWAKLLPGILYVWSFNGEHHYQLATDNEKQRKRGRKYVFRKGIGSVIHEAAAPAEGAPVWLIEGTKQVRTAAGYAPDGVGVYGIAGCRNWHGLDWSFLEGRDITIVFDGDVLTNHNVFMSAKAFGEALSLAGAACVRFARVPGSKSEGLDDWLGVSPHEKRAGMLVRLIEAAGDLPKRAPAKAATPFDDPGDDLPGDDAVDLGH